MARVTIQLPSARRRSWLRRFLRVRIDSPTFGVIFPRRCPHCLGEPAKEIAVWTHRTTGARPSLAGLQATETHVKLMVPVCAKTPEPVWIELASIVTGTIAIMTAILVTVRILDGASWLLACVPAALLAATWRLRAARGWIRLVWFDDDRIVLRCRRDDYARQLAAENSRGDVEAVVG